MPSRDVTEFRENGKSTLIVVEYKPLLPAFVTVDYCLLLAKTTVSITNTVINIMGWLKSNAMVRKFSNQLYKIST